MNVPKEKLEGRAAFDRGQTIDDCPYPSGNTGAGGMNGERIAWMTGWLDRKYELKFG